MAAVFGVLYPLSGACHLLVGFWYFVFGISNSVFGTWLFSTRFLTIVVDFFGLLMCTEAMDDT